MTRKLKPLLWRTTNREVPCYFFGTLHTPDDWTRLLSQKLLATLDSCDCLCVECILDVEELQACRERVTASGVDELIPPTVVRMLRGKARRVLTATSAAAMVATALDPWLVNRVRSSGKLVSQLETMEEQLVAITSIMTEPVSSSCGAPHQPLTPVQTMQSIQRAYLRRDLEELDQLVGVYYSPTARCWLERHVRMARRLLTMFEETPKMSYFVAFGLSHLRGPANVLELLSLGGVETEKDGW